MANPLAQVRQLSQGVGAEEIAGAVGGLALVSMLPSRIVKGTDQTAKLMRLAVAIGLAFGAGFGAKQFLSKGAAQAAVLGGLAGAAAQALQVFANVKITGGPQALTVGRRIGETMLVSPSMTQEGETVQLIRP